MSPKSRRSSTTTTSRSSGVVIEVETPDDGRLYLARVEPGHVVLSTGEELLVPFEKLQALAEQVVQERAVIGIRSWWTPKGIELVDLWREPRTVTETTVQPRAAGDETPF